MRATGLVLAIAVGLAAAAARADTLQYLQIEANEGASSGGHAAIRLRDAVYHFQYRNGLLLLSREAPLRFVHDYAGLDNRPIHALSISVSPNTRRRIQKAFEVRLQSQTAQLDRRDELRQETALLADLLRRARGGPPGPGDALAVEGLGYFGKHRHDASVPEEASLAALRSQLIALHGRGFLDRRIAALRTRLVEMPPRSDAGPGPPADAYAFPQLRESYGRRYADAVAEIAALQVLRDARPLAEDATRELPPGALPLGGRERAQLRRLARRLDAGLLRLAASEESGWGTALLVGMARRAALERSLVAGRLVVLDTFPEAALRLPASELRGERDLLAEARVEADATLRQTAAAFFGARPPNERYYADLEDAANRELELQAAWAEGAPLRLEPSRLVPKRAAAWHDLPVPLAGAAALAPAWAASRRDLLRYERSLARLYGYGLVTRNCVSELFATIYDGLGDRRGEIRRRLGGFVDPERSLAFIPWVSRDAVRDRLRVVAVREIPSYRELLLHRLRRHESRLRVALLESNTLTARSYRRNPRDSFFLLFADGPILLRPIAGAVNLVAGVARTATGLLFLPFDGGRALASGAEGALLSLPELALVDLRKGTNPFVSTKDARVLAGAASMTDAPGP